LRDAARTIVERASILPRGVFFALGVGAAFGLGVVVAGGIGTAHGTTIEPRAKDALARAEERAHKLDDVKVKLTYADELKKPDPVRTESLSTSSKSAKAGAPTAAPVAEAPPPHLEPAPAPLADAATATPASAPTPTLGASSSQRPAEAPAQPEAATAPRDDDGEAPPERVDDKRIQAALAHVLEKHDATAPAVVQAPASASKTFALQVASSPTRAGAEAAAKKIGHDARVVEGEVGGKAVFRVRLGSYADRAAAERAKGALSMPSFIVAE
jgi:hypothetical protein